MKDKEQEKQLESFIQHQRKTHEGFPDLSDKVMAAIREAPEPKQFPFQALIKQLQGLLTPYSGPAWKFAAAFTVLIISGGFYFITHSNRTPENNSVVQSAHIAKGDPFILKYLVKSRTGDTALLANDTTAYLPGDVFQAVYWSAQATRAHLYLNENNKALQCLTCDSVQGIPLEPAQGGYFPFAVELDSNPGEAFFAAAVSEARMDGRSLKKKIYELMENPNLSPKTAGHGRLNKSDGIRYFLFRITKGKKDARAGRK